MSILYTIIFALGFILIGFVGGVMLMENLKRYRSNVRDISKPLCFIIEGNNIYLNEVYVELDYPILYSCIDKDDNEYLALCVDATLGTYLLSYSNADILSSMENKEITMREAFRLSPKIYKVDVCDNNIENDLCTEIDFCDIDNDDLPQEGAYLK